MPLFPLITTALLYTSDAVDLTDEKLVEQALKASTAFAALYDRHVKSIYRYLYSKVSSHAEAEDLTSQVFLAALESLHRYPRGVGFRAWLFGIARRKAADFYRKRKLQTPLDDASEVASPGDSLLVQVAHGQSLQALAQLITRLSEDEQELLRLRFGGELSFTEIGNLLGMKESAVKMRLYRLIERIHKAMEAGND